MKYPALPIRLTLALLASLTGAAFAGPYEEALSIGEKLATTGQAKEAIAAFDKAIELRPDSAEALVARGRAWLKQEKSERALDDFNAVLKREPANAAALAGKALAHWWKHETEPAKQSAEAAIKADEKNPDAHFVLGRTLLMWEFWDRDAALRELTRAIELDPKMAWAYFARSGISRDNAESERALADASKAIQLDPSEARFYEGRARLFERMQRDEDALRDLDKAIELKPSVADFYGWRGRLHSRHGRHAKAMSDLNAALRLRSNFPEALVGRGYEHALAGRMAQAERDFENAVRAAPEWPTAHSQRGWFRLRTGKARQALGDLNKAIEIGEANPRTPASEETYAWRGEAHFQLGQFSKAATAARETMHRRAPGSEPHAYAAILGVLAEQRLERPEKVRELLQTANAGLDPKSWVARVLAFLSGSGTANEIVPAAKDAGQRTEAHFYAGHRLLLEKNNEAAKEHFQWVREHGKKDFTEFGLACAELARLETPAP